MSETTSGNNDPTFQVHVDPSAEGLPAAMVDAYGTMNNNIAYDRAFFALSLQHDHLLNSQINITDTAKEALRRTPVIEERTALILGAGGCLDIPLAEIVTEFDKTTVVDVHTEQTEEALGRLPSSLLGKVSLVRAELSGFAKGLNDMFEQASEQKDFGQFVEVTAAMTRQLDVAGRAELGSDYSFVCSQLLMTQLASIPFLNLSEMIRAKYGKPLTMAPGKEDDGLIRALDGQNIKAQTGHVKQLRQLVADTGTVHLADTWAEVRGKTALPMVAKPAVDMIRHDFSEVRDPSLWRYNASLNLTYLVGSYALAPKPPA
jgi:hypothetical protein